MTKIKGAIEVVVQNDGWIFNPDTTTLKPNGLAFKHADLEAYVQQEVKKFIQAFKDDMYKDIRKDDILTLSECCYFLEKFEDFKKENHES